MLALIVAQPGPVNDGLVALLETASQVRKTAHVRTAQDAWDFVNEVSPDITLIHAPTLSEDLTRFIGNYKKLCGSPLLAIVLHERDRQAAITQGADIVVFEGIPSSKLAGYIHSMLPNVTKHK